MNAYEGSARRELPFQLAALSYARDFIGLEERGGANRGPMVEFFQRCAKIPTGSPWCAGFTNGCAEMAGAVKNEYSPLEEVEQQGFVQSYYEWAEARGLIVAPGQTSPGDLVLLWHTGKERYAHIAFLHEPPWDGEEFTTVEGNTNEEGEREGKKVLARERPVTSGTVFVRWAR